MNLNSNNIYVYHVSQQKNYMLPIISFLIQTLVENNVLDFFELSFVHNHILCFDNTELMHFLCHHCACIYGQDTIVCIHMKEQNSISNSICIYAQYLCTCDYIYRYCIQINSRFQKDLSNNAYVRMCGSAWVSVSMCMGFSEYLLENRVPRSADFNTYPIRIFSDQIKVPFLIIYNTCK